MSKERWKELDEIFPSHEGMHSHKLSDMYIRGEAMDVPILFKGARDEVPGIVFKVINKKPTGSSVASLHNVVIAREPGTDHLKMWCGDLSVAKADGERESRCEFWQQHTTHGGKYMCKHAVLVFRSLDSDKRQEIMERLGESDTPSSNGEKLSVALKLGMNTLIYGPTGSGKTHDVLSLLNSTAGTEVCQINITDGLEDVDLLQKLLPDGTGWQRRAGELRAAFDKARKKKVIVLLEELTRSSRSLRNLLIKATDRQGACYTLHDFTSGEMISVPCENLSFVATANISYNDTSELDAALARRFTLCIFYDYDAAKERDILIKKVGMSMAQRICKVTKMVRDQYRVGRLPYPLDTGSVLDWANLIDKGMDFADAANLTWLYRIVEKDGQGYPEAGQLSALSDLISQS